MAGRPAGRAPSPYVVRFADVRAAALPQRVRVAAGPGAARRRHGLRRGGVLRPSRAAVEERVRKQRAGGACACQAGSGRQGRRGDSADKGNS